MNVATTIAALSATTCFYVAVLSHRFTRVPGWREEHWFTIVALTAAFYSLFDLASAQPWGDATSLGAARLQLFFAALHAAAWLRYCDGFLRRPPGVVDRVLFAVLVAAALGSLVPEAYFSGRVATHEFAPLGVRYNDAEATILGGAVLAVICASLLWLLARFFEAWKKGVPYAIAHVIGIAVLLCAAVNDSLVALGAYSAPYLADLGLLVPMGGVGYLLTARFAEGVRVLDSLKAELEVTVQARTKELSRTQEALLRAEKLGALGQLAAGVAHEVNNPAAAITANLHYLRRRLEEGGRLPEDGGACLEESQIAIERIAQIVRQLLEAGRLAASAPGPCRSLRLARAVGEAVRLSRARCRPWVTIHQEVSEDLWALGQEQPLVQVLVNLIVNASQAIPEDRGRGQVTIIGRRLGDRVELTVEDDGHGMSEETLRRVFEPFFTTKAFGQGTGLGLAVSRGLMMNLGGELRISSTLGCGSRATLDLAGAEPEAPGPATRPPESAPAGPLLRVMLVDDDPRVGGALMRSLRGRYEVALVNGARPALDAIAGGGQYDLVLCDLMMEGGGGEQVYETLSRQDPALAARLVFLTGGATTPQARDFLARQPQPVLYKPLDLNALARLAQKLAVWPRAGSREAGAGLR